MPERHRGNEASLALRSLLLLVPSVLVPILLSSCLWNSQDDRVFVYSDPAGAEVWINGDRTAARRLRQSSSLDGLMGGDHLIEVRKAGYETERRVVRHWDDFKHVAVGRRRTATSTTPAFPSLVDDRRPAVPVLRSTRSTSLTTST